MDQDIQHFIDTAATALTMALELTTQRFRAQLDGIAALPSMPVAQVAPVAPKSRRRRKAAAAERSVGGVPANDA